MLSSESPMYHVAVKAACYQMFAVWRECQAINRVCMLVQFVLQTECFQIPKAYFGILPTTRQPFSVGRKCQPSNVAFVPTEIALDFPARSVPYGYFAVAPGRRKNV